MGELWDGSDKSFDKNNLDILYKYLTGNAEGNYDNVASLASSTTTAANIRSKTLASGSGYSTKSSSQDVIVTLGGLKWEVVYLSNNTDAEPTLTLWLSNSTQDAFKSRSRTEGTYYGYYEGGLYSDWSADWHNVTPGSYPSNMYGTSYIRAVTLNNGGKYSMANAINRGTAEQKSTSAFASFTMDEYGMTDYIVKPTKMPWQRDQSSITELGMNYTQPNEAIAPSNTKWYSGYDYSTKTNYTAWENDNLWLPSLAETGYSNSKLGMWGLSENQRKNYDGSTQSISLPDAVGSYNQKDSYFIENCSWLRSGTDSTCSAYNLAVSGSYYSDYRTYGSCAVRPALHLNLKNIQDSFPDLWEVYASENYASGIGTETSPYIIKTAEQFAKLAKDSRTSTLSGQYYKLGANIDLSDHIWAGIGNKQNKFMGSFNGEFYCVTNLRTSSERYLPKGECRGLFAMIQAPAIIKNVIMKNCEIRVSPETGEDCGAIVGNCETNCLIENCIVENITISGVKNNSTGGLIAGCFTNGYIRNCLVKNSNISTNGPSGGICGWRGTIENCSVLNTSIYTEWGVENNRDISIGWSDNSTITNSFAYAICNTISKKVMYGDSNAWGDWSYNPILNDGYPVQKSLFHIGGISGSQNVYNYLTATLKFSVM